MTDSVGIDIGSQTTKAVLFDGRDIIAAAVVTSEDEAEASARRALDAALQQAGLRSTEGWPVVCTGAGPKPVSFARQQKAMTTCLARGTHRLLPAARLAIDVGAESVTVVKVNDRGRVSDWANHDKCAAGTGLFLQQMARLMQMPLEEMARLASPAGERAEISSTCAVFAESEVISHVHRVPPTPKEAIVAGIYLSTVHRIIGLCKRIGIEREVAVTGGVALNRALVAMLEQEMGLPLLVPESPQIAAALGAALIAAEDGGL